MKHARADYDRIQDPAGLIPEDEPVFLLRGQDIFAPQRLRDWANAIEAQFTQDPQDARDWALDDAGPQYAGIKAMVKAARLQAEAMEAWQERHGGKVPDLPADLPAEAPPSDRPTPSVMDLTDAEVAEALDEKAGE